MAVGIAVVAVWLFLLLLRGGFWLMREDVAAPADGPGVVAVVPARNEADVVGKAVGSLGRQRYAGPFQIVLVDDDSSDGTADVARAAAGANRLTVIAGEPLPAGWTGKL